MKETPTVVIGQLVEPHEIRTQQGETVKIQEWAGRAAWAYLRLVYGRSIDAEITERKRKVKAVLGGVDEVLNGLLADAEQKRPLQFIMSSSDVVAVASLKHLLIEPRKVYETAAQILGPTAPIETAWKSWHLHGETFLTGQGFAGIKVGYQVDGGDLLTRFAVRVGVFARVEMCFNPLSWLGVSGLSRFGVPSDYERVLRIQKLNELFPRLQAAIVNVKGQLSDLEKRVEHTKEVSLSAKKATMINGAFCMAYGLGEKSIEQVMDRFQEEKKTQYGLAMAQSWAAEHGEHRKASPTAAQRREDHVPQSLSTISGATLLIDVKNAEPRIRAWLQGIPLFRAVDDARGKLARELLKGRMP